MLAAVREDGGVLLERRPERGVWGGLWCLPEFTSATAAADYAQRVLQGAPARPVPLATVEHAFTHFDLVITPLLAHCSGGAGESRSGESPGAASGPGAPSPWPAGGTAQSAPTVWYRARAPAKVGLPAPIRLLIERLAGAEGAQAQLFD